MSRPADESIRDWRGQLTLLVEYGGKMAYVRVSSLKSAMDEIKRLERLLGDASLAEYLEATGPVTPETLGFATPIRVDRPSTKPLTGDER